MIDSHCHLHYLEPQLLEEAFDSCVEHGIKALLNVCCKKSDVAMMRELSHEQLKIYRSVGIHPCTSKELDLELDGFIDLVQQEQDVVAVGECGLDQYHKPYDLALQVKAFSVQIEAAKNLNLPIIVHTREARTKTKEVLEHYYVGGDKAGVIHCFTETKDFAKAALDLGFYISFSGIITYAKAAELREVVKYVPADRLLIETDSPYLAPVPVRSKDNHPANVRFIAETVANIKGIRLDEVSQVTTNNFSELFLSK